MLCNLVTWTKNMICYSAYDTRLLKMFHFECICSCRVFVYVGIPRMVPNEGWWAWFTVGTSWIVLLCLVLAKRRILIIEVYNSKHQMFRVVWRREYFTNKFFFALYCFVFDFTRRNNSSFVMEDFATMV